MSPKLKELIARAERWPDDAQQALVDMGEEIELELQAKPYDPTADEPEAIDEALAQIDRGVVVSAADFKASLSRRRDIPIPR